MDKKIDANRLLRALGDVDDKYIDESIGAENSGRSRAVTTSLRKYSGIIGAVAAALLLLAAGSALFGIFGSNQSRTTAEGVRPHSSEVNTVDGEISMYIDGQAEQAREGNQSYSGVAPAAEPEATEAAAEAVEDDLSFGGDSSCSSCESITEVSDIDALSEMAGFDITVPDSVSGSTSCEYYYCETAVNIAEIRYLDEDGNVICTVRKALSDENISGCTECFSVTHKIDVEGLDNVSISGNGQTYGLAVWMQGDYSYSILLDDMVTEQEMLDLISQVN